MDIEELIIEILKIVEQSELQALTDACFYTCLRDDDDIFTEIIISGELCVYASSIEVATMLFFLLEGIFNHGDDKLRWYTKMMAEAQAKESHFDSDFDSDSDYDYESEITPLKAFKLWIQHYKGKITEHNVLRPIVIHPTASSTISLKSTTCDIWTLPRIRRQFSE
jgi:hypothetical protein